ncbi:PAS domain S-box protein [Pseudomonadota bacterium]
MQIRHRIYISLLLLSLLPLTLISVLTEQVSHNSLKEVITNNFQALAKEKAIAIGRQIDASIHETQLLANSPAIINEIKKANTLNARRNTADVIAETHEIDQRWIDNKGNTPEAKQIASNKLSLLLNKIKNLKPDVYGEIIVTDRSGATLAMTKTLSDYYQADEYWWQEGRMYTQGGAFLDDRGYDDSVGAIVIGVTVPVIDNNEFIGIFKINFRVSTILDIVSGEGLDPGYGLALMRSDDTVISSSKEIHRHNTNITASPGFKMDAPAIFEITWHDVSHIVATHPMKHAFITRQTKTGVSGIKDEIHIQKKWYVIYDADQSIAFAKLEHLREKTIILAISSLLLAALVGFFLTRDINQPLQALKLGTELIGKGDLAYRIGVKTRNEFGDLAHAFNNMTQTLQQSLASREELNREIAERKEVQTELRQFKSTLDKTMDCVFMFDPQTLKFFYVNRGAISQVGYSHKELMEMTPLNIKPEFDEDHFRKMTDLLIQGPSHRTVFTTIHRHKEGYDIPVEIFLQYVEPVDTPPRFLAIVSDITEQKRAEKEKEQLQRHLNELLDAMPSIVVAVDPQAQITHWNRQAEKVTGILAATAVGKPLNETLLMIKSHQHEILKAIREGKSLTLERVTTGQGEEHIHINILIYPLTATGIKGAVLRLDDVTEKTHMEEMMVQTEKMLSVGGLAGGMAHELNNPLGGMVQGIQNIRRRLSNQLKKNITTADEVGIDLGNMQQYMKAREIDVMLDMIADAGERASNIVNNMLRFSRSSENLIQSVDLKSLINQTVELASVDYDLKKRYDFRGIEIKYEYPPNLAPLKCIPGEIQQVLLNLLRNAAQALSEQATPSQKPLITLRIMEQQKWVHIEVEDNGPGMDAEIQKRVFEPFYTTKPPGQGTGLGLSVSYYIIHDEHQGKISVESEPNRGTKFIIMLPK